MDTEKYNSIMNKFFKSPNEAISEIINLQAILNLPKGTEHFLSDLHGEADTFIHILKNASGVIRLKLESIFKNYMTNSEIQDLLTLIYYPEERLKLIKLDEKDIAGWYKKTLLNLIKVLREISNKYTRSKVRKALPQDYAYIMDELINMTVESSKESYYENILSSIIELGEGDNFIIALCRVIQRLAIDHLHIIGDIYDRGNGPDVILDRLMNYHSLDIQWGNHDVLWIGAYLGNLACIANVIRINCGYKNLSILESSYGINLRALETFAIKHYANDNCENFKIKNFNSDTNPFDDMSLLSKMYKAITVLQFKLENKLIKRHPEWEMDNRILLEDDLLTQEDISLMNILKQEFIHSKRLKEHIEFLVRKGSMYLVYNKNLLMHGCVPTDTDGNFTKIKIDNKEYSGKALYDKCNNMVLNAYNNKDKYSIDYMWYLWCGKNSPLFGRDVMRTYETYMLNKKVKENKNPYYDFVKEEKFCDKVLQEFGATGEYAHIINGHMPVKVIDGENPISGNGKHIIIDGGLSRAYHKHTGIGGYTLMSNSRGLYLTTHAPFCKIKDAIERKIDLQSQTTEVQAYKTRVKVKDTDNGKLLQDQIDVLKMFLKSYYHMDID
ncbi:MAG: fructose-1,6-bisphosphatase [Clostridia bacterium]|nr:fructose-1,6-bisphosphatase [Clostridia bacterium]